MLKRTTRMALMVAAGLVVAWLEFLLIPSIGVPGVKLGLANIATLIALYLMGVFPAALVCAMRVLLAGFLFGSPASMAYALCGGLCALAVMALLKQTGRFSCVGVSVAGGCAHNGAQLALAALIARTPGLAYYLPVLLVSGVVTGAITGVVARTVLGRIKGRQDGE